MTEKTNIVHADLLRAYVSLEESVNTMGRPQKLFLSEISKWSLRVAGAFFIVFIVTLVWEVWSPGYGINKLLSSLALIISMISFLAFEIALLFDTIKAGLKEKRYAILDGVKECININEIVVNKLSSIPTEALKLLKNDLVQECERRDINAYFYLGAVTKLGILPSLYSIYLAYKNVFNNDIVAVSNLADLDLVAQLYILLMTLIVGIYARSSLALAACNRMKRMIYWIDRALAIRQINNA